MNTTELLALFREEVFDKELPYLWSDALVYRYIDDAQKQFCRDTYGIADARSFKLSIQPGTEWYKLDARILKIRNANNTATGRELPVVPSEGMSQRGMCFDGRSGPIRALISGLEKNTLRTWPRPQVADEILLWVFRLPEEVGPGDDFEIDDQHVMPLLHWVKHKAYAVQDAETYDKQASDRYLAAWRGYCAAAKDEQNRAMHPAGVVAYGGI